MAILEWTDTDSSGWVDTVDNEWVDGLLIHRHRIIFSQIFDLVNRFHRHFLVQQYYLSDLKRVEFVTTYSIKLMAILTQYYGDVPRLRTQLQQWYWDATVHRKELEQPYDDLFLIRNTLESNYTISETLTRVLESNYSITTNLLRNLLDSNFDIKNVNLNRIALETAYALLDEGVTISSISIPSIVIGERDSNNDIVWTTDTVNFNSFNINASMGQYLITCSVELSTLHDYLKCPFMTDIKLIYDGTEYIFFVKGRSKNSTYSTGVYSMELESPISKLDFPYSRPLTSEDNIEIDTNANTIVSSMAAKKGITVDYQILNWLVKSTAISIVGNTPLSVIRNIVNAIGGIVQTKPDGSMLIISKYPISPTEFASSTPDVELLLESDIDAIQEQIDERDGLNAYVIGDQSSSSSNITLEVLDVSTNTKIVKGFRVPFTDGEFPLETSGGSAISIDKYSYAVSEQVPPVDFEEGEEWEIIEFIDWQGSTSKPIYSIVDIDWIQDELTQDITVPPLSVLDIEESGLLTVLDTDSVPSESLLRIKYMTKYWKWTIRGPLDIPIQFYVPELED